MTHRGRNVGGEHRAGVPLRGVVRLLVLALAGMALPSALAADGPKEPRPPAATTACPADDLDVAVHVRAALRKDPQLKSLNLGVRMSGGVAHLSGPVPSNEAGEHARKIVAKIPGVLEVRTAGVYVESVRRERKELPLSVEGGPPTQTHAASPFAPSDPPGRREGAARPDPGPEASAGRVVTLLAPEAVAPPSSAAGAARLTANPRTPATGPTISAAIDRLRQRDARFRPIRTEVEGGAVRILAGEAPGEHVMAFAQAVARLPGVRRVVVQNASAPAR